MAPAEIDDRAMARYERDNHRLVAWVMAALAIWGGLLSLGALLFGYDAESGEITMSVNPLRGLIVAACVAVFVGGWALALRSRRSRGS